MVRAKFFVSRVDDQGNSVNVQLTAVYSGSEENKQFWNATPSGQVTMQITNKPAADQFAQGKQFYVDFTPADSVA